MGLSQGAGSAVDGDRRVRRDMAAVVLAAGQGRRMNSPVQKQYMELLGRPMIYYALAAFEKSTVGQVVLVTGPDAIAYMREEVVERFGFGKVSAVVAGGEERYHSVYEGLKALDGTGCGYVLVHDGARPLVDVDIIERAADGAVRHGACVVGMPVKDTIKRTDGTGYAVETPDRSSLWQIQTPQAFSLPLLLRAYDRVMADPSLQRGITDDAMVVEAMGGQRVRLIEGSYENLKVTTPEDMAIAEALLLGRAAAL